MWLFGLGFFPYQSNSANIFFQITSLTCFGTCFQFKLDIWSYQKTKSEFWLVAGPEFLEGMWIYICPELLKAIDTEPENDVLSELMFSLSKV